MLCKRLHWWSCLTQTSCRQLTAAHDVAAGVIEYWSGSDYTFPQEQVDFTMKLDTDLFALAKAKTTSKSLEISKDGTQFSTFSTDR